MFTTSVESVDSDKNGTLPQNKAYEGFFPTRNSTYITIFAVSNKT